MSVSFCDFDVDTSVVAPVIYGNKQHHTTNRGVVISAELRQELKRFLSEFNATVGIERAPYYRIDAYFDDHVLWILEINASFVDGWGTALNLARASGIKVESSRLDFPYRFASMSRAYLPELELFVAELACLGHIGRRICEYDESDDRPIYVYGRVGTSDHPHTLPYDGLRLDNKLNLGVFSRKWNGNAVMIPYHYISRFCEWEKVPREVFLKFCDKGSAECARANRSVILRKPVGKAPFIKRCYNGEVLIAQDIVRSAQQGGNNCQLVILVIGDEPITGYVQYSRSDIINDSSIHGPMWIN